MYFTSIDFKLIKFADLITNSCMVLCCLRRHDILTVWSWVVSTWFLSAHEARLHDKSARHTQLCISCPRISCETLSTSVCSDGYKAAMSTSLVADILRKGLGHHDVVAGRVWTADTKTTQRNCGRLSDTSSDVQVCGQLVTSSRCRWKYQVDTRSARQSRQRLRASKAYTS